MSRKHKSTEMVTKSKKRVLSTPDHTLDSPSRDSDSMCDSETASPVPFLCTQDGGEGTADVVWNYYNSNSKTSQPKNSTPISKKSRKSHRLKFPEKKPQATQHRRTRLTQKKTQLPLELFELNQYVDKLMETKSKNSKITTQQENTQSGSEEDIFADAPDHSPKSIFRTKKCLRKNVLSSRFSKPEPDTGLESDDSLNECLVITSQAVEEKILNNNSTSAEFNINPGSDLHNMNDNATVAILRDVKSPYVNKFKGESPGFKNDSFDSLLETLNDSALERLTHMPAVNRRKSVDKSKLNNVSWKLDKLDTHDSPSRFSLIRHSSMPESPSIPNHNIPSTSNALPLGRYNSLPFKDKGEGTGDSPIRCTPLEIEKKRQQAREKLLAKRLLPFTQTQQQSSSLLPTQSTEAAKNCKFELKVPSVNQQKKEITIQKSEPCANKQSVMTNSSNIQALIEKKRQEALMKLRRRQLQK